jgi:hypothetical protein
MTEIKIHYVIRALEGSEYETDIYETRRNVMRIKEMLRRNSMSFLVQISETRAYNFSASSHRGLSGLWRAALHYSSVQSAVTWIAVIVLRSGEMNDRLSLSGYCFTLIISQQKKANSTQLIYRSIYLSTRIYLCLYRHCELYRFFSFLFYTNSVRLLGRGISLSEGRYLHTE